MKKNIKWFGIILSAVIMTTAIALFVPKGQSIEKQVQKNVVEMMAVINQDVLGERMLSASSNPYDYIVDNEAFENIVKLGKDAIPFLLEKISASKENGLEEYLLAIAVAKIAGMDLNSEEFGWTSGKDFAGKWHAYKDGSKDK
ncbi:MAG: hypothetical protein FWF05_01555 [Oscillospiraceae bacterium]|nr:hypothetical protein [Oscillospiraceae bacterium]